MKHETTLFKIALVTIVIATCLIGTYLFIPIAWIKIASCILFVISGICRLMESKPIGIIPIMIGLLIFLSYLNLV